MTPDEEKEQGRIEDMQEQLNAVKDQLSRMIDLDRERLDQLFARVAQLEGQR